MNALARLKLVKRLLALRNESGSLGAGGAAALRKLKIAKEMLEIRQQLGFGAAPAPAPSIPEPVQPSSEAGESPHLKTLRKVAKGLHDGEGLDGMFGLIQEAVNALDEAGQLQGEIEAAAHGAITHWAEMEERLNG